MCSQLQLNKYDAFEPTNNIMEILKIKTILGCIVDYTSISKFECELLFALACEFGHINIVQALLDKLGGDIGRENFEKAQCSPNRDIPKYLLEYKTKSKQLERLFSIYADAKCFEPKIKFN
jgi:hypothetical protein